MIGSTASSTSAASGIQDQHFPGVALACEFVLRAGSALRDLGGRRKHRGYVKLFRVWLLQTVLAVGWYFTHKGLRHGEARVPFPMFAVGFLVLCLFNSFMAAQPSSAALFGR